MCKCHLDTCASRGKACINQNVGHENCWPCGLVHIRGYREERGPEGDKSKGPLQDTPGPEAIKRDASRSLRNQSCRKHSSDQ